MQEPDAPVSAARPGPLAGIKLLDLTTVVLGPLATQILGDLGAEVIKIEAPEGDIMRYAGPARHREMGHVFLNLNRNKRSLVLDLKQPNAAPVLLALAAQSDVLMHNMRPQAMARLGFAWERLSQVNSRLVYCAAQGYGRDGPRRSAGFRRYHPGGERARRLGDGDGRRGAVRPDPDR